MATAKKLPSGSWRVLCYDGRDKSGKRKYVSFTAETKNEAELQAALYLGTSGRGDISTITVKEAIERYIRSKQNILSPSTIRGYRQMQKKYYGTINDDLIKKMSTESLQLFVNYLAGWLSPKSVSNIYGLLMCSITMFRPDAVFRVTLPKRMKKKKKAASSETVIHLFEEADGDLKICIALAAFGSMRRGEICALKYGDVNGNTISVHADMVQNETFAYEYKEIPKTSDSIRDVRVPAEIIKMLGRGKKNDFIIKKTPGQITHGFIRLRKRLGVSGICFHDLRHYYASIGAVLGVPDIYLSEFGGWRRGSSVMKEVYQNVMDSASQIYSDKMNDHFSELISQMQHDATRKNEKSRQTSGL